jgi:hypothetical protein
MTCLALETRYFAAGGHFADAGVWRLLGAAGVAELCGMVTLRSL